MKGDNAVISGLSDDELIKFEQLMAPQAPEAIPASSLPMERDMGLANIKTNAPEVDIEPTTRASLGDAFDDLWTAIKGVPRQTAGAFASMIEGSDVRDIYGKKNWQDETIAKARAQAEAEASQLPEAEGKKEYFMGITREKLRSLPQNLAFSINSMGAGLVSGLAGAVVGAATGPGATASGYAAGAAGSGWAAYRMDANMYLRQIREALDNASVEVRGVPLTDDEFISVADQYKDLVAEHGLWEAVPEALGNVVGLGLGKMIFKNAVAKGGFKAIGKTALGMGGTLAGELSTETVTQMGQQRTEVESGLRDEAKRSFTSAEDWMTSAKEIAPDVLLLTGALGATSHLAGTAARRFTKADEAGGAPTTPPPSPDATPAALMPPAPAEAPTAPETAPSPTPVEAAETEGQAYEALSFDAKYLTTEAQERIPGLMDKVREIAQDAGKDPNTIVPQFEQALAAAPQGKTAMQVLEEVMAEPAAIPEAGAHTPAQVQGAEAPSPAPTPKPKPKRSPILPRIGDMMDKIEKLRIPKGEEKFKRPTLKELGRIMQESLYERSRTPEKLASAIGKPHQAEFLRLRGLSEEEMIKQIVNDEVKSTVETAKAFEKRGDTAEADALIDKAIKSGEKLKAADGAITEAEVDKALAGLEKTKPEAPVATPAPTPVKQAKPTPKKPGKFKWSSWVNQKGGLKQGLMDAELFGKGGAVESNPDLRFVNRSGKRSARGGYTLDALAEMAHAEGIIPDADPNTLLNAMSQKGFKTPAEIEEAAEAGPSEREAESIEEGRAIAETKQKQKEMLGDAVDKNALKPGDKVRIIDREGKPDTLTVKEVTPEGDAVLEDGELYRIDEFTRESDKPVQAVTEVVKKEEPVLKAETPKEPKKSPVQRDLIGAREGLEGKIPTAEREPTPLETAEEERKQRETEAAEKKATPDLFEEKKPAAPTVKNRPQVTDVSQTDPEAFEKVVGDKEVADYLWDKAETRLGNLEMKGIELDDATIKRVYNQVLAEHYNTEARADIHNALVETGELSEGEARGLLGEEGAISLDVLGIPRIVRATVNAIKRARPGQNVRIAGKRGNMKGFMSDAVRNLIKRPLGSPSKFDKAIEFYVIRAKNAMHKMERWRGEAEERMKQIFDPLKKKDIDEIKELLIAGDVLNKEFSDAEMDAMGVSDKVKKAYRMQREYHAETWERLSQYRKQFGKETGRIVGHVPHLFENWTVYEVSMEYDPETGEQVAVYRGVEGGTHRTLIGAVEFSEKLDKERQYVIQPKMFKMPDEIADKTMLRTSDFHRLAQKFEGEFGMTRDEAYGFIKGVAKTPSKHRFLGSLQKRKGQTGWRKDDIVDIFRQYYFSVARYMAMDTFKNEVVPKYQQQFKVAPGHDTRKATDPVAAAYVNKYIDDVLGVPTAVEQVLTDLIQKVPFMAERISTGRPVVWTMNKLMHVTAMLKLGMLNLSSGMVNLTQLINTFVKLPKVRVGKAMAHSLKPNARYKAILKDIGVEYDISLTDVGGYSSFHGPGLVGRILMGPFRIAELYNRRVTGIAAYETAKAKGMSRPRAIEFAREMIDETQFDYSVADTAAAFRYGGPVTRMIGQFKPFLLKQLEFITGLKGWEHVEFWTLMAAVAGVHAVPFMLAFGDLGELLTGRNPLIELKQHLRKWAGKDPAKQKTAEVIMYGLPSLINVDISKRVALSDAWPQRGMDFLGPFISTAASTIRLLEGTADKTEVARTLAPSVGNLITAIETALNNGNVYDPWSRERLKYKATTSDIFVKGLGFRPMTETRIADTKQIAKYENLRYTKAQRKGIDKFIEAFKEGDAESAAEAVKEMAEQGVYVDNPAVTREIMRKALPQSLRGLIDTRNVLRPGYTEQLQFEDRGQEQ